ncbi:hypothetical protein FB451DRAFT_1456932, partial [Mycena latifolia]
CRPRLGCTSSRSRSRSCSPPPAPRPSRRSTPSACAPRPTTTCAAPTPPRPWRSSPARAGSPSCRIVAGVASSCASSARCPARLPQDTNIEQPASQASHSTQHRKQATQSSIASHNKQQVRPHHLRGPSRAFANCPSCRLYPYPHSPSCHPAILPFSTRLALISSLCLRSIQTLIVLSYISFISVISLTRTCTCIPLGPHRIRILSHTSHCSIA